MLLVDVCAWALPSTTTTHTSKAANNRAEGLPIMSDRTLILFLRVKSRCKPSDRIQSSLCLPTVTTELLCWKEADPDLKAADYTKLK